MHKSSILMIQVNLDDYYDLCTMFVTVHTHIHVCALCAYMYVHNAHTCMCTMHLHVCAQCTYMYVHCAHTCMCIVQMYVHNAHTCMCIVHIMSDQTVRDQTRADRHDKVRYMIRQKLLLSNALLWSVYFHEEALVDSESVKFHED